jgi:hypothetical protein
VANRFADLVHLHILIATLISAVSLAASTIAAVLDRKRALGLLRLMGMPVTPFAASSSLRSRTALG